MNDVTTRTLDETLDERSGAYVPPQLPVDLLMARAKREQRARRGAAVAGGVAAAAAVAIVVIPHLGTSRAAQTVPAGPSTSSTRTTPGADFSTATTPPVDAADGRAASYAWASALPVGAPFEGWAGQTLPRDREGRLTLVSKGRVVPLGSEPMTLVASYSSGPGEESAVQMLFLSVIDSGPDKGQHSLHVVSYGSAAREMWRASAAPVDLLQGRDGRVALLEGPTDRPTRITIVSLATGASTKVALPADGPTNPRFATWEGDQITLVDSQVANAQSGGSQGRSSRAVTYNTSAGTWTRGERGRWFGAAPPASSAFDPERNVVLLANEDGEVCAHLMTGPSLATETLACGAMVRLVRSPAAGYVLLNRHAGEGSAWTPELLDLSEDVVESLPVSDLDEPLRWEQPNSLVGSVPNADGSGAVWFRIDLGREALHERLPAPPPGL